MSRNGYAGCRDSVSALSVRLSLRTRTNVKASSAIKPLMIASGTNGTKGKNGTLLMRCSADFMTHHRAPGAPVVRG
jgi:hypothetical protein